MRKFIFLLPLVVGGLLALFIFHSSSVKSEKQGYVVNSVLFEGFNGTKHLKTQLRDLNTSNKEKLDSMVLQHGFESNAIAFREILSDMERQEEELSVKYTEDIWKRLNLYIAEFAKEKDFQIIFGATGSGSLMYASPSMDITDEILEYVNAKYDGE